MNFGDRKTQISSDAVPGDQHLTHADASCERLGDDLEPDAARALDEHDVARLDELADQRRRLVRVGDRVGLAVERVEHRDRARADGHQHVHARRRRGLAHLAVQLGLARAQLEHVAEHGDAPASAGVVRGSSSRAARIDSGLAL